jgi:predicted DNA-binding transcriptional regulator YafY
MVLALAQPGRPKGALTQHRRINELRRYLEHHPTGLTLYEIAKWLEVSPRTVRRYINGVSKDPEDYTLEPVETRGGGPKRWRIRAGEIPRKIELRRTQAYALLAARRIFEPMKGSAVYEEINMAVGKLLSVARRPGRGPNAGVADARLEERFLYLPFAPKNYHEKMEEFDDLFQCVSDLKPLTLRYRSAQRSANEKRNVDEKRSVDEKRFAEEKITIHPYAMVLHKDSIYCVGYHVERKEIRTLVLDRMRDTEIAHTEHFELPKNFSIDEYFQGELGVWRASEKQKVVIEFDAQGTDYVRMRRIHPSQRLVPIPGGGARLTMTVGNLTPVVSWVLEWGKRAKVIEPPDLIERVKAELSGALSHYGRSKKR